MLINSSVFSSDNQNDIRLSLVKEHQTDILFKQFSIKFIVNGNAQYTINQRKYKLSNGDFIFGFNHQSGNVSIDKSEGFCIDISRETLQTVLQTQFLNESIPHTIFDTLNVQKFNIQNNTRLGRALSHFGKQFELIKSRETQFTNEIFYHFAESIIYDQIIHLQQFKKLNAHKIDTNYRLYEFVNDAKNFMDKHFCDAINLSQIAAEAKLSEYYFIRLFKQTFDISPYQYLLKKRLHFAQNLIENGISISAAAHQSGFTDIANFSKTFKTVYGISPKNYQKIAIFDKSKSNNAIIFAFQ